MECTYFPCPGLPLYHHSPPGRYSPVIHTDFSVKMCKKRRCKRNCKTNTIVACARRIANQIQGIAKQVCCAGIICAGGFAKVEQEAHVQNKLQNRCKKRKWMHEALQNKKQGSHLKGGIAKHVQDTLMQEEFQNLCKMHNAHVY